MVQLIVGKKGKGKTKYLLEKVNIAIKSTNGTIVYLDKSTKHMYELNNKVRLINCTEYAIRNCDQFIGFISGIISQDHDLDQMYLDSFLRIAAMEEDITALESCISQLERIGDTYGVTFVISISLDKEELPDSLQDKIIMAL